MFISGVLMFDNAGAMWLSAWGLAKWHKGFIVFALAVLTVNILPTFTYQVGFWDWLTVLIDFALVGILLGRWGSFVGGD